MYKIFKKFVLVCAILSPVIFAQTKQVVLQNSDLAKTRKASEKLNPDDTRQTLSTVSNHSPTSRLSKHNAIDSPSIALRRSSGLSALIG